MRTRVRRNLIILVASVLSMMMPRTSEASLVVTGRDTTYNVSFNDLTFAGASITYNNAITYSFDAGDAGSFTFSTKSLATGVYVTGSGDLSVTDLTFTPGLVTYDLVASATGTAIVNDGYTTAAGSSVSQSWLVAGTTNGLPSLEFLGDGGGTGSGYPFTVTINLPGNWTSVGTGAGQIDFLGSLNPGWSQTTFSFDSGTDTTVLSYSIADYPGNDSIANINFVLIGVPEPSTWTLLGSGVGLVVLANRWRARRTHRKRGKGVREEWHEDNTKLSH